MVFVEFRRLHPTVAEAIRAHVGDGGSTLLWLQAGDLRTSELSAGLTAALQLRQCGGQLLLRPLGGLPDRLTSFGSGSAAACLNSASSLPRSALSMRA